MVDLLAAPQPLQYENEDELLDFFHERDLTDGLPIVIPTKERVEAFISKTGFPPESVVGAVDPARGIATVQNVAINALMAGCKPEHLSVVLGAISAIIKEPFHLHGLQCTTNPVAPLAIINGPIRRKVGINSGRDALSPGQHANGPIGRAIRFVLRNIGGAVGDVDRATLGSPAKYTFCLGEAEEESPWEPLHVALGYAPGEDIVTVIGIESFINTIPVFKTSPPLIEHFARAMRAAGTNIYWSQGSLLMVINPGHARILADDGYDRRRLQEALFEEAMIPIEEMPSGNIPQGEWKVRDEKVLITSDPEQIYVMVAGGPEPYHSVYMTGFGVSQAVSAPVWSP